MARAPFYASALLLCCGSAFGQLSPPAPGADSDVSNRDNALAVYAQYFGQIPLDIGADDISCPTTPIVNGATISGTLNQNTSCRVIITTSLGTVNDIADVYSFQGVLGARVIATLIASDSQFFGLPYLALLDSTGHVVKAIIGTASVTSSSFSGTLDFTLPSTGQWRLVISGLGGQFSTAIGNYTLQFQLMLPPRHRAAKH
jgi:hypothetical protein